MQLAEKIRPELSKILSMDISESEKISKIISLIVKIQNKTNKLFRREFIKVVLQNLQLLEYNKQLNAQLKSLQRKFKILDRKFKTIFKELSDKKEQEKIAETNRIKRKNQKCLPKREPITIEMYNSLIIKTNGVDYPNRYKRARIRLALALLAITGVKISELLPIRMVHIKRLFSVHWITIDRSKRGVENNKDRAFLTDEGIQLIVDRKKDFEFLSHFKNDNSYIFTAEYSDQPLTRERFTNVVNQFLKDSSKEMEGHPNLSSHSFRTGFISKLWREPNDIEFIKQTVVQAKLTTTSLSL